ncbi:mitochondrial carnitine/acylcarnitine carrier protein putative [Thamnocephalis sphaerospora]|uniref:Mitochondrial carnitine/acylcarnitine carrier protein putative n=1 Tax=Thamnocephalis sphaerospora TaxID=78915 RepID=A0A4P9XYQ8_9FUNG|nr:mitochondrial carnitine/acylcarnitine carrier protein putative [Thamnocephalis sphaerospora]|eukprot:RKP10841.1 mitochondrial carnitine/acylcarnitine carrier protein putative [Thamnocephalis sphaerospora]
MSDAATLAPPAVVSVEPGLVQADVGQNPLPVVESFKAFVSGGFGGICLVAAGHPLDLITVLLQTTTLYSSALDCARKTVAKDGVRGLYRGMAAPLVGATPISATSFWGYDLGKRLSQHYYGQDADEPLTVGQICFAGGFSAIPTTALMTPIERVKCLLQIQLTVPKHERRYKGPLDVVRSIWREEGARGIYRGTTATILRDVPNSVAYFGVYEYAKRWLTPAGTEPDDVSLVAVLGAGGLAGVVSEAISLPADVLKSRQQTAPAGMYRGLSDVFVKLMRHEGPSALFRGIGPALLHAFPANAACFLGVELSLKALNTVL